MDDGIWCQDSRLFWPIAKCPIGTAERCIEARAGLTGSCLFWILSRPGAQRHSMAVFSISTGMVRTGWVGMLMTNLRLIRHFRLLPCRLDQAEICSSAIDSVERVAMSILMTATFC